MAVLFLCPCGCAVAVLTVAVVVNCPCLPTYFFSFFFLPAQRHAQRLPRNAPPVATDQQIRRRRRERAAAMGGEEGPWVQRPHACSLRGRFGIPFLWFVRAVCCGAHASG